jgi:hypothetical protein
MPKENVDYSNTIIYKICCNDETVKDVYVGHTTNFIQRKYAHKTACNKKKYGLKIYNVIQANGGWDNWNMVEIARYNCKDSTEARIKEQEHYNMLKASINSCYPFVDKANNFCNICNLQCDDQGKYTKHITCGLHLKKKSNLEADMLDTMLTKRCLKVAQCFCCEICNYSTSKKSSYSKHLLSMKHLELTEVNKISNKSCPKVAYENNDFNCKLCSKVFKSRVGLWKHNKICKNTPKNEQLSESKEKINGIDKDELIMLILKQNAQLMEQNNDLMEIVKNGTHNITNNTTNNTNTNTNTNSHNKAFNLNLFLNETCKNAMNITDFIDSIKLQLSDFMNMGEVGFVEGISNIIVKNLNSLDETVRPIHCTDQKRETFYVKDQNIWEKEEDDKKKLHKMVKSVAYKNEKLMKTYKETYPDYNNPDSKRSDQYSKIMIEAMDCKDNSREKIIRNISKATIIKTKT